MKKLATLLLASALVLPVYAQDVSEPGVIDVIAEEEIEARAKEVGHLLRCVVCQNQSIEESEASLAEDMRRLVRARIAQGDTNEDVIAHMQNRYGDFVLLKPPVQSNTYVLWFLPFVLVGAGLVWFGFQRRQHNPVEDLQPLSDAEKAKLDQL